MNDKRELELNEFEIKFGEPYKSDVHKIGIRKNHILSAINSPDRLEHFEPKVKLDDKGPPLTFIMKDNLGKNDKYSLFIMALRKGTTLIILNVYKIYFSDIPTPKDSLPISVLESFVQQYGLSVSIENSMPQKFFLDKTIAAPPGVPKGVSFKITDSYIGDAEYGMLCGRSKLGPIIVGIVFAIDVDKYKNDLRKHN